MQVPQEPHAAQEASIAGGSFLTSVTVSLKKAAEVDLKLTLQGCKIIHHEMEFQLTASVGVACL